MRHIRRYVRGTYLQVSLHTRYVPCCLSQCRGLAGGTLAAARVRDWSIRPAKVKLSIDIDFLIISRRGEKRCADNISNLQSGVLKQTFIPMSGISRRGHQKSDLLQDLMSNVTAVYTLRTASFSEATIVKSSMSE